MELAIAGVRHQRAGAAVGDLATHGNDIFQHRVATAIGAHAMPNISAGWVTRTVTAQGIANAVDQHPYLPALVWLGHQGEQSVGGKNLRYAIRRHIGRQAVCLAIN